LGPLADSLARARQTSRLNLGHGVGMVAVTRIPESRDVGS